MENIDPLLVKKYNLAVPRYTSYPTVPFWKESISVNEWEEAFKQSFSVHNSKEGLSLYLHLPFCETMCTYCGCNKRITTDHKVENEYIKILKKEWELYLSLMNERPLMRELHLGGGTPTFFSPEHLKELLQFIFDRADIHPQREFSVEGHPNNTTRQHLQVFYDLGFRRISYGVQDNDPDVQRVINRIQPVANVRRATDAAREIGFKSVNYDLIYGLPLQTLSTMQKTIEQVLELKPDRIAFYSYAHVPWKSRMQRLFDETDLPDADTKLQLYQLGKKLFTHNGYTDIGMDHFALSNDDLYLAWKSGTLHRNFMGYTTQKTSILLGLGVSSISDIGNAFAQNNKILQDYYSLIRHDKLAVQKGYFLNEEDVAFRHYILDISCKGETSFKEKDLPLLETYTFPELKKLEEDNLIAWNKVGLQVTTLGRNFIRNICRAFDLHLLRSHQTENAPQFSKAI